MYPKNIDLICALHLDRPKHLHIHFEFWEKEPKQKYRKKQTEYRHKGKIPQAVIDKMHERLNLFLADEHIYYSRDEALRQLKELSVTHGFERFCEKEARREITELAKDLSVGAKIFYGHKDMEPFRPRIDKIVNLLLQTSKAARKADLKFHEDLAMLEQKIKVNGGVLDEINHDLIKVALLHEIYDVYLLEKTRHIDDTTLEKLQDIYDNKQSASQADAHHLE